MTVVTWKPSTIVSSRQRHDGRGENRGSYSGSAPSSRFRARDDGVVFRRCGRRLLDRTGGSMVGVVHRLNAEADMKEIAEEPGQHLAVPVDAGLFKLGPAADTRAVCGDSGQPGAVHDRTERDLLLPDGRDELLPAGLHLPLGDRGGRFRPARSGFQRSGWGVGQAAPGGGAGQEHSEAHQKAGPPADTADVGVGM